MPAARQPVAVTTIVNIIQRQGAPEIFIFLILEDLGGIVLSLDLDCFDAVFPFYVTTAADRLP